MKLAEKYWVQDDKLIIQETHDPNPVLDSVRTLKNENRTGFSDHKHVGRVPTWMIEMWCREAGVSFTDQQAVKDIVHRKLLSGEYNALRPWTGTYRS